MKSEIMPACRDLMETTDACILTTVDGEGRPFNRAMFNLRNKRKFPEFAGLIKSQRAELSVLFGTNTSSLKVAQMRANPVVSVYYCRPDDFQGLMLSGSIEFIDSPEMRRKLWLDWWTRYYPLGPDDPDYTILRLEPRLARGWNRGVPFELELGSD